MNRSISCYHLLLVLLLAGIGICGCPTGSDDGEAIPEGEAESVAQPQGEEEPPPSDEGEGELDGEAPSFEDGETPTEEAEVPEEGDAPPSEDGEEAEEGEWWPPGNEGDHSEGQGETTPDEAEPSREGEGQHTEDGEDPASGDGEFVEEGEEPEGGDGVATLNEIILDAFDDFDTNGDAHLECGTEVGQETCDVYDTDGDGFLTEEELRGFVPSAEAEENDEGERALEPGIAWSSYLGGYDSDSGGDIAVDGSGNILVTGSTVSLGWTYGGWEPTPGGRADGFVVKLTSSGAHIWSTYLGGNENDGGVSISVDNDDNVLVTGSTESSDWISGGWDTTLDDGTSEGEGEDAREIHGDAFVVKLTSTGAHVWSTYLGGDDRDRGSGITVDNDGNVLVTGSTGSSGWISGGWDTTLDDDISDGEGAGQSHGDAFVVKLTSSGAHVWSSYLGGDDDDHGSGIGVDNDGNVLAMGNTESSNWVSGGWITTYAGGDGYAEDAFVVKLTSSGAHTWSSYVGGNLADLGSAIAVDGNGNAVITGSTMSVGWVSGGWDPTFTGDGSGRDAFVAKLASDGAHVWSSYLGELGRDDGSGIVVDGGGNVLVTGWTESSAWLSGGWDTTLDGDRDAFVVKLKSDGAHVWSSCLGGDENDYGRGIAVDDGNNVVVTGQTESSDWISGGWDSALDGSTDGFVVKIGGGG